jgi:hypothetical protein
MRTVSCLFRLLRNDRHPRQFPAFLAIGAMLTQLISGSVVSVSGA